MLERVHIMAGMVFLGVLLAAGAQPYPFEGVVHHQQPYSALNKPGATVHAGKALRIGSYNIENFTDGLGDGRERTEEMAERQAGDAARIIEPLNLDGREPWYTRPPQVVQKGMDLDDIHARPGLSAKHVSDHYPIYVDLVR